ncbi:hypothetical protein PR048_016605 [Dryococelus australis]|uniref:Thioredoxin domain-containing protein n=1 Tax=Dryococelus australis TaxID=614101 RepID=A0ABQ9H766_9NEOP|nr:hypothetical protein PR048_016605 [Dryococelus australis]
MDDGWLMMMMLMVAVAMLTIIIVVVIVVVEHVEPSKDDCEPCERYESELIHLREDLVDMLNAWVVKAVGSQLVRSYNPSKEPALVFFRHGVPLIYDAENERTITKMLKYLNETCEEYGMRINTSKTKKSMVFGKGRKLANIKIGQVNINHVRTFKYLGSTITEDLRCLQDVKTRIEVAKEAFNRKRRLQCGILDKALRKRLGKLEAFEMWMWRRMERISWVERVSNEVLERVDERRKLLKVIRERKNNWMGHSLRRECLLTDAMEGIVCGKRLKGRRRYKLIDDIKGSGKCMDLKRLAEDRRDTTSNATATQRATCIRNVCSCCILLFVAGPLNDDLILHTFVDNKEPTVRELSDDDFEHLTQASSGATTVKTSDCVDCRRLQARWEAVGGKVKTRMNVARVNKQTTGAATSRRFDIRSVPAFLLLRQGKMYRYNIPNYDVPSFVAFATDWYKNARMEVVPVPKSPFELEYVVLLHAAKGLCIGRCVCVCETGNKCNEEEMAGISSAVEFTYHYIDSRGKLGSSTSRHKHSYLGG